MAQVRVRAVANVMGLRRGDTGDVETGSTHVDAMINAGYLEVLEYLEDPAPIVPVAAKQFAQPNSFGNAEVVELPDAVEVKTNGKNNKGSSRPRPSRSRSDAGRGSTGDAGDGADARQGVGDSASGHGEAPGGAPDAEAGQ